jgi:hypothetical protein
VTIEQPAEGTTVRHGEVIRLRGRAVDREDGEVPCNDLLWAVYLGHNAHAHPQQVFFRCDVRYLVNIPDDHGAASELFITAELTYEDKGGPSGERPLTGTATVRLNVE